MRESGEPMECGIFDFYKVFSRAFGEEGNGVGGVRVEGGGCRHRPQIASQNPGHQDDAHTIDINMILGISYI